MNIMPVTVKTPNYSPAQEAIITAFHASVNRPLTFEDAGVIAANPLMNDADGTPRKARSITAKIGRMEIPYARKVAVRKDGTAVASKADIVAEIALVVSGNLEGLDKAPRDALVALRKALAA
jgi:hypothetical protein